MEDCVFCKIAKGEIPTKKVFEDTNYLGILDIPPLNKGHVQLIPKKHYRWVWDVPNFGEYWETARKVAQAQMKGLGAKMVEFLTHGMEIVHAHIWIVPIYDKEAFIDVSRRKTFNNAEMENAALSIKSNL